MVTTCFLSLRPHNREKRCLRRFWSSQVCVPSCLCVCVCVCMHAWVCVYVCLYVHVFMHVCVHFWKNLIFFLVKLISNIFHYQAPKSQNIRCCRGFCAVIILDTPHGYGYAEAMALLLTSCCCQDLLFVILGC